MTPDFLFFWQYFYKSIHTLKRLTKPITISIIAGSLSDLHRNRVDLIVENALLPQQLIVLNRQVKLPRLTSGDRLRMVLLARCTRFWKQTIHMVQPDTLLRWHRKLFKLYWTRKSKPKRNKPRISTETIHLIQKMAYENRLWGAQRIRGELLKVGIRVSKLTIQRYLPKKRQSSVQTWATFLMNHAGDIWVCDFTVAYDLLFRPIFILVILELNTRLIIHSAVPRSPSDVWTAQQLREATPWGCHPKVLIRDRDCKYGPLFASVPTSSGIHEVKTPFRAPKANAVCERFMGSMKRVCLDHILVLNQRQLEQIVKE